MARIPRISEQQDRRRSTAPYDGPERRRASVTASARAKFDWFAGLSRHGIVAAERITQRPKTRTTARQVASQVGASILIGLGVSLFVHADLGVPAYDVMLTALRDRLGISLGQASWLFTGILFAVAAALGRRPRISGLFFLLGNGVAVDLWLNLINDPEGLFTRMLFVALGTIAIAGGIAMVVHAGLTGGAIEQLMNASADRGLDPFRVRRGIEIAIVVGGVLLGGDLGPATIFFVLTMSPILRLGQQALVDHRAGRTARLAPTWD